MLSISATTNSVIGPMATNMADCAKLYHVISGPDKHLSSSTSIFQPEIDKNYKSLKNLKNIKIGIDRKLIKNSNDAIYSTFMEKMNQLENMVNYYK